MRQVSSILGVLGGILMLVAGLSYLVTKEFSLPNQVIGFAGLSFVFFYVYVNIEKIIQMLGSPSTRYGFYGIILIGLLSVVLGLVNFIAFKHPQRYDATGAKLFSLSPQTIQIVESLKEPVQITTFFVSGSEARDRFDDLLDGYRVHSDQIKISHIDPEKNPLVAKQFGITTADTVVVAQGDKQKRVMTISEEAMTNALISVTRGSAKSVCFLQGHGEHVPSNTEKDGLSEAKAMLEKQSFGISTIQLFQTQEIPEECTVLVMAGPNRPLFEPEKPVIEKWVMNGGRLVLMIDPAVPKEVADYAESWGVVLHDDLVVDPVAQSFFGNAAVPVAVAAGPHKITDDFEDVPVFLPLTRSLDKAAEVPNGGFVDFLLQTASDQAWGETDQAIIHPPESTTEGQNPQFDEKDFMGPLNLAAVVTYLGDSDKAASEADKDGASDEADKEEKSRDGVVAIFGDSDFATNGYFHSSINGDLFLNTISFLSEEEDLVSIRAKEASKQTLSMTQAQGNFVFVLSLLIMPGLPFLLGIYTFFHKRNL